MPPTQLETWRRKPTPQVGAVLLLNAHQLEPEEHLAGSIDWNLGGSCVVVGRNRVLTLEHVVLTDRDNGVPIRADVPKAVFVPWEGIFPFSDAELIPQDQRLRDDLVLATLDSSLSSPEWMRSRVIERRQKRGSFGWALGYGRWVGLAPDDGRAGLQRRVRIDRFGVAPGTRQHRLDMSWYAAHNQGRQALADNSGGPMCWESRQQGRRFVSIMRESLDNLTIGSWIEEERDGWLKEHVLEQGARARPQGSRLFKALELKSASETDTATFELPPGTSEVRITLNGSANHLQLAARAAAPAQGSDAEAPSHRNAGQFLARRYGPEDLGLSGAGGVLRVDTAYVGRADEAEFPIQAQLCVYVQADDEAGDLPEE